MKFPKKPGFATGRPLIVFAIFIMLAAILVAILKHKNEEEPGVAMHLDTTERMVTKRKRASLISEEIRGFYDGTGASPSRPRGPVLKSIADHPSYRRIFPQIQAIMDIADEGARESAFLGFFRQNLATELPFFMEFFHAMHDDTEEGRVGRFGPVMTTDANGLTVVDMALWKSTEQFLVAWSEENAYAAMEYVITSKDHTDLASRIPGIIETWSQTYPDELIDYAMGLNADPEGEDFGRQQIWALTDSLLKNQPQLYLEWALSLDAGKDVILIDEMVSILPTLSTADDVKFVAQIVARFEDFIENSSSISSLSGKMAVADPAFAFNWAMERKAPEVRDMASSAILGTLADINPSAGIEVINSANWTNQKTESGTGDGPSDFDRLTGGFVYDVISIHPHDRELLVDMLHSSDFIQNYEIRANLVSRVKAAADRYHPPGSFDAIREEASQP